MEAIQILTRVQTHSPPSPPPLRALAAETSLTQYLPKNPNTMLSATPAFRSLHALAPGKMYTILYYMFLTSDTKA